MAVPFGCVPGRGGDTRWASSAASADCYCSPPPPPRPLVTSPVIATGAVYAFGGAAPSGDLGAAATPHAAEVREQVVAAAASEGWVDLTGDELEGVLAEVEAALADETAAEESARVDAYISSGGGRGAGASAILPADAMDAVHATATAALPPATTAAAGEAVGADDDADADLDELIEWQSRMTLGDSGGNPTVSDTAAVEDGALCPVLCPVCEADVLAPWPVGRGVTCAAGCGVHAPIEVDASGGGVWGGDGGALSSARCRLADVLAAHADGGCGERLLGVACGPGGGGVLLGCGVCGVWERVL